MYMNSSLEINKETLECHEASWGPHDVIAIEKSLTAESKLA